jgi:hypothetical protein
LSWFFLLVLACGGPDVMPGLAPPQAEVLVRVEAQKVAEGEPVVVVVEAIAAEDWVVDAGVPVAEGLDGALVETDGPVHIGERSRTRWRYHLTGPPGSYIIALGPSTGAGPGDQTREFEPSPIFVDIGVPGPTGGPMSGLQAVPPPEPTPWGWIAAGAGGALALALLGLLVLRRLRQSGDPVLPPPDPPHVTALREWDRAREAGRTGTLDDPAQALELSRVLRVYLEEICGWPATARTTREILDFLEREGAGARRLDVTDRMRTSRILDATDRLKFAREGGGEAFFAAMDEDFRSVIRATCPLGMTGVSDA